MARRTTTGKRAAPRRAAPAPAADSPPSSHVALGRLRVTEAGAAFAAFLVSLTVLLLGGFQHFRGSEIVVLPPQHVFLYRDAPTPDTDALVLAVEAGMINTASADYGDVAVQAYATLAGTPADTARFPYDASVEPVTRPHEDGAAMDCPIDARCIVAAGSTPLRPGQMSMLMIERRPALLSVPGGSSRSVWLAFALGNCRGEPEVCGRYQSFEDAVAALRQAPDLQFEITLEFHSDGRKRISCGFESVGVASREDFLNFLEERGWATLRCQRDLPS